MRHLDPQKLIDDEHLRLLRIGYFIAAGTNLFVSFIPLIYVAMGLLFFFTVGTTGHQPAGGPEMRVLGLVFALVGGAISLLIMAVAVMKFLTARAIGQRRSRVLCLITGGISCFAIPYGTALGVATFIVLGRPSVRAQFPA